MARAWRWLMAAALLSLAGCSTTQTGETGATDGGPRRGALLTTGGIQLGPNVGKDFVGWQGDGRAGF
jgi:hypothetical protein